MQTTKGAKRPGAERKRPDRKPTKQAKPKKAGPQTAQQTIPYRELFKDGICRVNDKLYTKSLEYEDINYQLAQADDQSAIFDGYCAFLNSFDSSLPFQLSFINHRSRPESKYKINIPMKDDEYSEMRSEYVEMLEGQIAKSNNGIVRTKLLTFGVSADSLAIAKPRLERVEADIMGNFKKLGVQSRSLNGLERLEILHGQLHPGGTEPFRFTWDMIPKTGLGTKDFIAPTSFDFRQSRLFRMGSTWGAASYMQIMASELSDKLLAELLEVDAEMTITMHIQTVDQAKAIKTIKGKVSDIDKMKVEEQKKAVRSGYDILSLMELIVGGKDGLQPVERTIIDRCARMVYRDFLNDPDNTPMPTLQNLYDLLCQQTEPEAKRLATALEIYVSGSLNIFNHKTNVDYRNARVVCFDLKKLGAGLRTIAMHIINDLMNSQVSHNFARGIATWCYQWYNILVGW